MVEDERGPVFCADAVADPITGVVAAGAVLEALHEGGRWLVDVALSAVAAALAGPTLVVDEPISVAPPRCPSGQGGGPAARRAQRRARLLSPQRGIGKITGSSAIAATAASRSSADGAR